MAAAEVWCFGGNTSGQLGVGNDEPVGVAKLAEDLTSKRFLQIACGGQHSVGLNEPGELFTWGNNDFGQLGRSGRQFAAQRVEALETMRIVQVAAGATHTAVLSESGHVYAWGQNHKGQVGTGDYQDYSRPKRLKAGDQTVAQVVCGSNVTVALADNGEVYACGEGMNGQLGTGEVIPKSSLTLVAPLTGIPIRLIAAGTTHCMALTVSGSLYCWGGNAFGQLGLGDKSGRPRPSLLASLHRQHITHVSCGAFHTAATSESGTLYTWGQGSYGQLGHGVGQMELQPRAVFELLGTKVVHVACGRLHTVALVEGQVDGTSRTTAYAWGLASNLGIGAKANTNVPKKIDNPGLHRSVVALKDVAATAAGDHTFLILKPSGASPFLPRMLSHLSLASLKALIANKSPMELQAALSLLFSSSMCMNASFLAANHMDTGEVDPGVDLNAVREAYSVILAHGRANPALLNAFGNATARLVNKLPSIPNPARLTEKLRVYIIIFENPLFLDTSKSHLVVERLCAALLKLNDPSKQILSNWWARLPADHFQKVVRIVSAYLSFLITTKGAPDQPIFSATLTLEFLYKANEQGRIVPYTEFYNAAVSERVDLAKEYKTWKSGNKLLFSLCRYPFLFSTTAKINILHIHAEHEMRIQVNQAYAQALSGEDGTLPVLVIVVRRRLLIQDALAQLLAASPRDLKKPIRVIFAGEEAIDQGGVTKEFFHLAVHELFDPNYGMFTCHAENTTYWFNPGSLENEQNFRLVGLILGLAIYNGVILDIHFPMVIYKQLLQGIEAPVTLDDLKDAFPTLGNNLEKLLHYDGNVEETFALNFVTTEERFGEMLEHELKPGGKDMPVTNDNRQEYVDLYVRWILRDSVLSQLKAFIDGFRLLLDSEVLQLFRPEELELLVCGSQEWDLRDLEKVTLYKAPYTAEHPTIRAFWRVVHELPVDLQKRLLFFCTGSDRVPVQGLGSMKFVIQSMGQDNEHLPASHTCFNILDLPEYSDEAKLKEKLTTALMHAEGFGLV